MNIRDAQHLHLRESGFDAAPVAQLVIDRAGALVMANEEARVLFQLDRADLGKPFQDLDVSSGPVELGSRIEAAYRAGSSVKFAAIASKTARGELRYFDVLVTPVAGSSNDSIGASISFMDVTAHHLLSTALETTNNEFRSAIAELENSNAALQSTNEELESMNQELQSANEELETIYEELRRRTNELNGVSELLETIVHSMRAAVVVLDASMSVTLWNSQAEELWGLRREEVAGKGFLTLEAGLPVAELALPMQVCREGKTESAELTLRATDRQGREFSCRIRCNRLANSANETRGLIMFMEAE